MGRIRSIFSSLALMVAIVLSMAIQTSAFAQSADVYSQAQQVPSFPASYTAANHPFRNSGWSPDPAFELGSSGTAGETNGNGKGNGGEGGDAAGDATNPTAPIKVFQIQNSFIPNTYDASGYANTFALQVVLPFKTRSEFFPSYITRTTLPVISTADPDADIPIGPGNDTDSAIPLNAQSGLGDLVFISIFNHPTKWGSWGIGPGFVAPTATRFELGEQSWKFSPTFAVINTSIKTWQLGVLGMYNFPLDDVGSKSLQFQPLIVKQLGDGWYTGWGDDLWTFNTDSGSFAMPLQLRLGKASKQGNRTRNVFVTGFYTPDALRDGPTAEWGIKLSISRLFPAVN